MLSKFLSILFMLGCAGVLIVGSAKIIAEIRGQAVNNPLYRNTILQEPGIVVTANRTSEFNQNDYETILSYYHIDTGKQATGNFYAYKKVNAPGAYLAEDVENFSSVDYVTVYENGKQPYHRALKTNRTFGDIRQSGVGTSQFTLSPRNAAQRIQFIFYELLVFGSYATLLFILAFLFNRFSKRIYFTAGNTRLIKISGVLLLIPQLMFILFYFVYGKDINPVNCFRAQDLLLNIASYNTTAGIDWYQVILGMALIAFSYLLKNGLDTKDEHGFTV